MAVRLREFRWEQSPEAVFVALPLPPSRRLRRPDVLCWERYLKVNAAPFLFEALLFAAVDEARSAARVEAGAVFLTLRKRQAARWEALLAPEDGDKEAMRGAREAALRRTQAQAQAQEEARAAGRRQRRKCALEAAMELEAAERKSIEGRKEEERRRATQELEGWKEQQQRRPRRGDPGPGQGGPQEPRTDRAPAGGPSADLFPEEEAVPAPRPAGTIAITFTPRAFPTALRESRLPEEEEWLQRQAEARRVIQADAAEMEDLQEEEKDPDWLKEKGNKMFETGNYLAAVNAYNLAIRINNKIPALYLNRAACHLRLRNLHKALEDASKALDLLTPPVPDNARARVKAHVRRGTAFCELELYAEGLQDYIAALKIEPSNKKLEEDAENIRRIIQGNE